MLNLIKWKNTGEYMVVDLRNKLASAPLATDEQNEPLENYELDYDLIDASPWLYTIVR